MENKNNPYKPEMKKIEKSLFELKKLFEPKKCNDYDDRNYDVIYDYYDVRNLFDLSIDEDYYKPIRTNDAFNGIHTEYESKGDKDKTL